MRATTSRLIAHDRIKYSVDTKAAGRAVLVLVYAERIVPLLGEDVVDDHPAASGATRSSTIPGITCPF
jgi:hypothetical protein